MKNNKIFLAILFVIAMLIYYIVYMNRPNPEVFTMKSAVEVKLRQSVRFVEEFAPEGSTMKVQCTSENPLVATVTTDHLSVTGKGRGTTLVTCKFEDKEFGTVEVTVK